jgi:hypothetical protein
MEHSDVEIPQKQTAVITDAAESIISLVTSPGIESDGGHPRIMALTASDDLSFR